MSVRDLDTQPRKSWRRRLGAAVLAALGGVWLGFHDRTSPPSSPDLESAALQEQKPPDARSGQTIGAAGVSPATPGSVPVYTGNDRSTRELLGLEGDAGYATRVAALEALLARGTDEDFKLLYAFLNGETPAVNLAPEERSALEKLLYDSLISGDQNVGRLKNHLLDLLASPGAKQSASSAALASIEGLFDRPGDHSDVIAGLWSLQAQDNTGFAGPALAALGRIEATHPGTLDKQRLGETVNALLFRPDSNLEMRILALRLGSWLGLPVAHQVANTAANATDSDDNLRLTALEVVEKQGSRADLGWLRELEERSEYPVNAAARRVARSIEKR